MANKPLTKAQLVAALAAKVGSDKKTANAAVDALSEIITGEVANGGAVTIPNVGKISCRARPARMGRNPATGEPIKIPPKTVVKARIVKQLKDAVLPRK